MKSPLKNRSTVTVNRPESLAFFAWSAVPMLLIPSVSQTSVASIGAAPGVRTTKVWSMSGSLRFPEAQHSRTVLRGPWASASPPPPTPVRELAVELAGLCLCDTLFAMGSHYHDMSRDVVDVWDADLYVTKSGQLGIRGTDTELTLLPPVALFTSDHYETRNGRRRKVPILKAREDWQPLTGKRRQQDRVVADQREDALVQTTPP